MAKRQKWTLGSVFQIQLSDDSFTLGHVIGIESQALNSFIGVFYAARYSSLEEIKELREQLRNDKIISVQFVTRDLLDSGDWAVIGNISPPSVENYISIEELRDKGFIGVKIIGSGIMIKLLEAVYKLYPWDGFARPDYLDSLLFDMSQKPQEVLLKDNL
jgi:hypothetical protein